jgi:hypothetical protein
MMTIARISRPSAESECAKEAGVAEATRIICPILRAVGYLLDAKSLKILTV